MWSAANSWAARMSSFDRFGYWARTSAIDRPCEAIRNMSSTAIRVPRTEGFPNRIPGSETMRRFPSRSVIDFPIMKRIEGIQCLSTFFGGWMDGDHTIPFLTEIIPSPASTKLLGLTTRRPSPFRSTMPARSSAPQDISPPAVVRSWNQNSARMPAVQHDRLTPPRCPSACAPSPAAPGGTRPASPCGTCPGRSPSRRGSRVRGSSPCSARGW